MLINAAFYGELPPHGSAWNCVCCSTAVWHKIHFNSFRLWNVAVDGHWHP